MKRGRRIKRNKLQKKEKRQAPKRKGQSQLDYLEEQINRFNDDPSSSERAELIRKEIHERISYIKLHHFRIGKRLYELYHIYKANGVKSKDRKSVV